MLKQLKSRMKVWAFTQAARVLASRGLREDPEARLIIIADCFGRLANRLTVVANALAAADSYQASVLDVAFRRVLPTNCFNPADQVSGALAFPGHRFDAVRDRICVHVLRYCAKAVEKDSSHWQECESENVLFLRSEADRRINLNERLAKSAPGDVIVVTGVHVDSTNRRPTLVDSIRKRFPFSAEDVQFSDTTLQRIRSESSEQHAVVGVHVRHGDYRTWRGGEHFHALDQYVNVMRRIHADSEGRVSFLVVSDEVQDVAKYQDEMSVQFVRGSESGDLALLSKCDLIVATHSSFANWASFIGKVPVLTMRDAAKIPHGEAAFPLTQCPTVEFPVLSDDYFSSIASSRRDSNRAA